MYTNLRPRIRYFWCISYFVLIREGVSCRFSNSVVSYLCVSFSRLITSVGEERANSSAVVYSQLCGFCSEGSPLPLGALDRL